MVGTFGAQRSAAVLVAAVALVLALAIGPAAAAKTKSCPNGTSSNNTSVTQLTAKGVSCKKALAIAHPAGLKSYGTGFAPSAHYRSHRFKCSGFQPGTGSWVWNCKHGHRKVSFLIG